MGASRRRHLRFTFLRGATRTVGPRHAKLIAACVALAGISLLLPSEPSYDPWAWLV
jgi:hypothetical protein